MDVFEKMKREVEDLLNVLSGYSGTGVNLVNNVMTLQSQLSFVNCFFRNQCKNYPNTEWCPVQIKPGDDYFIDDNIHLNENGLQYLIELLFKKCQFMNVWKLSH